MTTVSETLYKAADLIEERGWVTGSQGWPTSDFPSSPLCLEGAIMAALGWHWDDDEMTVTQVDTCPAGQAVRSYLDLNLRYLFMWNDDSERTAAEVVEVLRAAAVIEAARESELVRR